MIRIVCASISSADDRIYRKLYEKASVQRKLRADRYLRREDKLRCVTAAALLKKELGVEEEELIKNDFGKPYIKDRNDVYFNLSHSGQYVVIAWGNTEVGVDVQQHDPSTDMEGIGRRFFALDEMQYAHRNTERFYEIWTKKESFLKYTGRGLHMELNSFSVLVPEPRIRYFYHTLGTEYSLSLCMEDEECEIALLDVQQLL